MKHLVLFFVAVLFAVVYANKDDELLLQFFKFRQQYNKTYATAQEHNKRFEIFKQNLARARELQSKEKGTATYGVTKFSDLTVEEFTKNYLMPKFLYANPSKLYNKAPLANFTVDTTYAPQADFDWRSKGVITKVYNQGQCGSCWAFSATETIESYWKLCSHPLASLSPQQIVDCDTTSYGCNGGWTEHAFDYVVKTHGQETWSKYPYDAVDGTCRFKAADVDAKISGYVYVTKTKDEKAMLNWVSNKGPLSVCVDASTWSTYNGGVIRTCGKDIDHCVQVTGYSTQNGVAAWNVRNSWGEDWGDKGYLYVERGRDVCAIAEDVTAVDCA